MFICLPYKTLANGSLSKIGLFAVNVDPEEAAAGYHERTVGPYRGVLPQAAIAHMEEQLSGACTMEIAAFDEFAKLLGDPATTERNFQGRVQSGR